MTSPTTPITAVVEHRPWPLPAGPWVMRQTWHDLLFAHWPLPASAVRARVPAELELDTFDGEAWLGVVPFRMSGVRPRFLPPLPGLSAFPELNLRTYVTVRGKPGVFFFTLEATQPIAVELARRWFHLPYHRARMRCERAGDAVEYASVRVDRRGAPARFRARYEPLGDAHVARAGTLEHWLTERYCLYAVTTRRAVLRGEIHHPPWRLESARAHVAENTLAGAHGLELSRCSPLLHFARRQEVVVWAPRAVEDAGRRGEDGAA